MHGTEGRWNSSVTDQHRGGGPPSSGQAGVSPGSPGHLDAETLSDHAEGLLDDNRDWLVRTHLAQCTRCTGTLEQLAEVRNMLSALPPPPVPDEVAARLDATLARAQQERAEVAPVRSRTSGGVPDGRPRRPRFFAFLTSKPQAMAGAAAAVVAIAVVGGYFGARESGPDQAGNESNSSTPTAHQTPSVQAPIATGRKYSEQDLGAEARQMVKDAKQGGYTPGPSASKLIDKEMRRLSDPDELAGCINAITRGHAKQRVVMADLAEFNGQPAAIVVLTVPDNPSKYEVAAVGAGCSAGAAHVLSRVTVDKR